MMYTSALTTLCVPDSSYVLSIHHSNVTPNLVILALAALAASTRKVMIEIQPH